MNKKQKVKQIVLTAFLVSKVLIRKMKDFFKKHRFLKYVSFVMLTFITLSLFLFVTIMIGGRAIVDEQAMILPATSTIVDQEGQYIGQLYTENRRLTEISDVPEHVIQAFIATEDRRFYDHAGIDFKAVLRAIYRDIIAFEKVEGASTITQQLSKNLFLTNEKTWMRKTKEVMASMYLERHYSKNEILELYLNAVYFGHGIYGINTASDYFFNKEVSELTVSEGAMLAGMIKAPNTYSPFVDAEKATNRRNEVINQMYQAGYLSANQSLREKGQTLGVVEEKKKPIPYVDDYLEVVVKEIETQFSITRKELQRGGYEITVFYDEMLQKKAYEAVSAENMFHASNEKVDASIVIVEEGTAGIKAVIGGRDYTIGKDQHQALTKRQPGSVIKPLAVYTPALEKDYHPYTLVNDVDEEINGYRVKNAPDRFDGEITFLQSVEQSKNTTAVSILDDIGIDYARLYLTQLGIPTEDDGLAIALGGLSTGYRPLQMATAYLVYLNEGVYKDSRSVVSIFDRYDNKVASKEIKQHRVFDVQSSWYTLNMLEKVVDSGTATMGAYDGALAGKTGTTEHPVADGSKDAWFVGLTPEYAIATWIGFDVANEENYLTKGSAQAVELTKSLLTSVKNDRELKQDFTKPNGVKSLEKPIVMEAVTDLEARFGFFGFNVFSAELTFTPAEDTRVVYHVYEVVEGIEKQIGKTIGTGVFKINRPSVFKETRYFIRPYNPLTKQEGNKSNEAILSFLND